jgi:hypothetical protein
MKNTPLIYAIEKTVGFNEVIIIDTSEALYQT